MFLSVVESSRPVCVRTMTPMILATVAACSSDDTSRARWPRQTSCLAVNWKEKRENGYLGTGSKVTLSDNCHKEIRPLYVQAEF